MIIAIIPARGGSKRIPQKNIKSFAGIPLLAYAINAAIQAGLFDDIIVSTDSEKIAAIARKYGASTPFSRPTSLSDDHTPTADVLTHTIHWLQATGKKIEDFCCIYPNPFITPSNLKSAYRVMKRNKASGVVPVTTFTSPVLRALKMSHGKNLEFLFPDYASSRSQDLPEIVHDVGQFYWWDCKAFLASKHPTLEKRVSYLIPRYLAQDLDTPEDWEIAQIFFNAIKKDEKAPESVLQKRKKHFLIRCDVSVKTGFGHLRRCMALARELLSQDAFILFVCRCESADDIDELNALETEIERLPWSISPESDALKIIDLCHIYDIDTVIIDHYRADRSYQKTLYSNGIKWLQFDGCKRKKLYCNFVLNPSFAANDCDYNFRIEPEITTCLIGPEFAFIREEFRKWKGKIPFKPVVSTILFSFGGGDDRGATRLCLEATRELDPAIKRVVLVSSHNPNLDDLVEFSKTYSHLNIDIRINEREIAKSIAMADIGLISGGTTLLEAAAMGLPSLIIQIADNQRLNARACERKGVGVDLEDIQSLTPETIMVQLKKLIENKSLRQGMAKKGPELVDGYGVKRVAQVLLNQ